MSSQAAARPFNSALAEHRFKPGQSGNPGGKPKRLAELRLLALENMPAAIERLKALINSQDDRTAFEAIQFTYLYAFGKPAEPAQLAHLEAMASKRMEVLVEPTETPVESPPAPPELTPSTAIREEVVVRPMASPEATGVEASAAPTSEPSGLRCLFRDKQGRCEALAIEGGQWCTPHRARLFEQIK